jgi:mono/diheme cytochrome c family protein
LAIAQTKQAPGLSEWAYFVCVLLLTLVGFGIAMMVRPASGHALLQRLGLEPVPHASAQSFYAARVAPLFQTHCVGCHGAARQKAGLRLDDLAAVMLGGRHGTVVSPGKPEDSSLFARIALPSSNRGAMPPDGRTPLSGDEQMVIRLWIADGASGTEPVEAVKHAPKLITPVIIPVIDPALIARQRAPLADAVNRLQQEFPGLIQYESRDSANLEVDAARWGVRFGDGQLAMLQPLGARIVAADLSGTAITDKSGQALAAMTGLRRLRLADTRITDATVRALAQLPQLHSLTVTRTQVSDGALVSLRERGTMVYGAGNDPQQR